MINQDLITNSELSDAVENDTTENNFKKAAIFLLDALNDWSTTGLKDPIELLLELNEEIKKELTLTNLSDYLRSLHGSTDAWKMEATIELIEMFKFIEAKNLEEIIQVISGHYRDQHNDIQMPENL